jgi:hypothetical protein
MRIGLVGVLLEAGVDGLSRYRQQPVPVAEVRR